MTKVPPTCPRCGRTVREPGLWSNAWQCEHHGEVRPYTHAGQISPEGIAMVARQAAVPVWVPHPMMSGWVVTGIGSCGDDRTGAGATIICCSGPGPLGGPADLVLIAEEPATGLGAWFAGIEGTDPGELTGPYAGKLETDGHPTPLWQVEGGTGHDDRVSFVGEASGIWLWAVLWPSSAGLMLLENMALADVRVAGPAAYEMLGYGAESPRMTMPRLADISD
jgi:hypothetical protein